MTQLFDRRMGCSMGYEIASVDVAALKEYTGRKNTYRGSVSSDES